MDRLNTTFLAPLYEVRLGVRTSVKERLMAECVDRVRCFRKMLPSPLAVVGAVKPKNQKYE